MKVEFSVPINENIAQAFENEVEGATETLKSALVIEAEKIRGVSMEIVPVDQGILRASAIEVGTNVEDTNDGFQVVIGYGGAAASYALLQHETPPEVFSHTPGKSWKYLERPMLDAAGQVAEAMAAALTQAFSGRGGGDSTPGPVLGDVEGGGDAPA